MGSVENVIQPAQLHLVQSSLDKRVLHYRIVNAILAHFGAQCGIFRYGDALVIHQDTCGGTLDAFYQCVNNRISM